MTTLTQAAEIEVRGKTFDNGEFLPEELLINGQPVLCPSENPVKFHEMTLGNDLLLATITMFVRKVTIGGDPR